MFQQGVSTDAVVLASRAPDAMLAGLLEDTDTDELDDAALVEVVAAWRRIESWAAARAARAAAALSERASMNPLWPASAGVVREKCVVGEELALRLGCSRRAARTLVDGGKAYDRALWPTGEALERGEIDERKARLLVTMLSPVPGQVAIAVQMEVLPRAGARTHGELAADIQRALVRVDPNEAAERAASAAARRRVCRPKVLPDGLAGIWAVLPAPAAVAVHGELDAVARRVRAAGDPRTLDQLRADALCAALLARGPRATGASGGAGVRGGGTGGAGADGAGTSSAGTGSTAGPGMGAGGAPAEGGLPWELDPLLDLLAGPPLAAQVRITVPLDVLMGAADGAAELDDYGAIDPATAEALARGGTWTRLVTDPLTGAVLDVGRTRHRPPADLARHVRTRDGTCVRPGCPTSAWSCELDHTVPFGDPRAAEGGATAADNLGSLCKRDHLIKTHAGFGLAQVAPGIFEWTTPTGHCYARSINAYGTAFDGVLERTQAKEGPAAPDPIGARRSERATEAALGTTPTGEGTASSSGCAKEEDVPPF